jgi:5-methylcytosine-specific restriction endonuclease McrA
MTISKRLAISKKIRFDVFKRDSFQCQYCGQLPPKVVLEIDHIHPVSKGGTNHVDNLITACFDCNRGKSNGLIESAPMSFNEKTEILLEKQEQLKQYEKLLKSIKRKTVKNINIVEEVFKETFNSHQFTETFKISIERFLKDLPLSEVVNAMRIASARFDEPAHATKYFCGICWNMIKGES